MTNKVIQHECEEIVEYINKKYNKTLQIGRYNIEYEYDRGIFISFVGKDFEQSPFEKTELFVNYLQAYYFLRGYLKALEEG